MMPFIGIDLGTTNSCVATVQQGEAVVIANQHGSRTTPSCVAFTDKKRLIGLEAQRQSSNNPANTVYDAKRLIGRYSDEPAVQNDKRRWPFEVVDVGGKPKIQVIYKNKERTYAPEEISSMVLSRMKQYAETFIGEGVLGAVITVPAYFNDAQRRATKDAARIAEIDVLGLLNEPTAAAIAYGLQENVEVKRNVLIFDLGGGTFDVTVLTIHKENFDVKATDGDTHLGGQDFSNRLFNHFASVIAQKNGIDIKKDIKATSRLREACEKAKNVLSTAVVADIHLDGLFDMEDFKTHIRRDRFEQLNEDLFRGTLETVEKALECANMKKEEIDEVVLVGGSTRIPKIQKMLADYFDEKKICKTINPDEAVARGAAAYAASLSGNPTAGMTKFNLKDVTPLSLGIETKGYMMSFVVPRNTQIPVKKSHNFTTTHDDQKTVDFRVFEGERPSTKQNHLLGNFLLKGIPPAPAGEPTFDTCFDIDNDGVLTVTAVEKGRQNQGSVTITKEGRERNEEEIQRMIEAARQFREEDEGWKQKAMALNDLEKVAGKAKKVIEERGQFSLSDEKRERMLAKCNEVLRAGSTQQDLTVEELTNKISEFKAMMTDNME